jgi:hypothetical protein
MLKFGVSSSPIFPPDSGHLPKAYLPNSMEGGRSREPNLYAARTFRVIFNLTTP